MTKKDTTTYVYGKHVLEEAMKNTPNVIEEVLFASNLQDDSLRHRMQETDIPVHTFGPKHPPGGIDQDDAHQGVVVRIDTRKLTRSYDDFADELEVTLDTSLILLGEVQDPHNVGAVIRNAAAFDVDGVLIPRHNQAQVTPAVVKVSAGMAFRVPLVSIGNVNTTIRDLKERDFWVYGLSDEGQEPLPDQSFETPTVFVLGNESSGIREKTREHCDKMISIPISDNCDSLNAAASTAVTFYALNEARK